MKRLIGLTLLCILAASLAGPALAWEYNMKGETVWRYRYLSRTGNNDIFGRVGGATNLGVNHVVNIPSDSTQNQHLPGDVGIYAGEPGFGPDANMTDYRATVYPKIKINKAISLSGSINLTSMGIHSAGRPYDSYGNGPGWVNSLWVPISNRMAQANVPNMFVTVQWWKISVKLPWFGLSTGTKTSGFGMGIVKNKYHDRASTSFSMTAPYGPLYIGFSPYFGRTNSNWNDWPLMYNDVNNPWRKDDDRDYFRGWIFGISYVNADLIIGFQNDGYTIDAYNTGTYVPRGRTTLLPGNWPAGSGTATPPIQHPDVWVSDSGIYIKYFNGKFFFNAEVDYFWQYASGRGTIEYRGGLPLIDQDEDESAWAYAVETGFVTGPLKVTANYFRSTGDDPATRKTEEDAGDAYAGISASYVYDWAYLMYYTYGAGTYFDAEGKGQPANLHHLGIRLDYAAACNLNLYGVFSYAWRDQPNAHRLGGNYLNTGARFGNDDIAAAQGLPGFAVNPAGINRAVPDHARYIGWEVDLGVDWKLLENMTWRTKFAYWQPGNWWAFAYPNTSRLYDLTPAGNSPQGVGVDTFFNATHDLGRDIDPLFALETTITLAF